MKNALKWGVCTVLALATLRRLLRQYRPAIPGPHGIPFLGVIPTLVRETQRRHEVLHEWVAQYGTLFTLPIGPHRIYVVSDPVLIDTILKDNITYPERPLNGMAYHVPMGLLALPTDVMWKTHRSSLSALFTDTFLCGYISTMAELTEVLLQKYSASLSTCDLSLDMAQLTLEILSSTVMGVTLKEFEEGDETDPATRKQGFANMLRFLSVITPLPRWMWSWFPVPGRKSANVFLAKHQAQARNMLRKTATNSHSMLTYINSLSWSEKEKVDEALSFMAAGHETTANTLTFAIYLLAQYPAHQDKIFAELPPRGSALLYKDLPKLKYTYAVFREALRLYPTVPFTARTVARTADPRFEKGSIIWVNMYSTCYSPTSFANPTEFRPERWLTSDCPGDMYELGRNFGGGNRACIGKRFAEEEAVLILALLVRTLKIKPVSDASPIKCHFGITLTPAEKLKLEFQKR